MDAGFSQDRLASLRQLLDFEQYKLSELLRQQKTERGLANGHPEMFDPDIRSCEEMIRLWTERMTLASPEVSPA